MPTQRLELTWIGKNNPEYDIANIEPRILIEDPEKSHGDPTSENMLIHGDNLLALKALLPEYEGKIKCIYIDPPYNTGNAFEHYDDSVEHSTWLSLMKPRLELLRMLLSDDGSIFVQIDDNEQSYLKVLMDEIFGRFNFVSTLVTKSTPNGRDYGNIARTHEYIHIYKKTEDVTFNKLPDPEKKFKYLDSIGGYNIHPLYNSNEAFTPDNRRNLYYPFYVNPNCKIEKFFLEISLEKKEGFIEVYPPKSVKNSVQFVWRWGKEKSQNNLNKEIVGYEVKGEFRIVQKMRTTEKLLRSIIEGSDITNRKGTEELEKIFHKKTFSYPKPESLIEKFIEIGTNKGDLVLDSFLGSGTTAAVAHKMGRRWIGIELGDHAYTHCKVRLDKVVDGEDQGGISKSVEWNGGGGYKFYELAPSFITIDEFGNRIIDEYYNDSKLVRAMCKLMNYTFKPSQTEYFKQGVGTGHNYLFVTTQTLSIGFVRQIVSHLGINETLVICPKKYEAGSESVDPRITIKKIPQSILKACQYGKKDYLLPIRESTLEEIEDDEEESN